MRANTYGHELVFLNHQLNEHTATSVGGAQVICAFVNDVLNAKVLTLLAEQGVKLIAMRCAGYNNVDLQQAVKLGLTVVRVPAYSPHAVAEHAVALILSLNRKIHRAHQRTRELDFSLHGLVGFDLVGKTVGVIGTGHIGLEFAKLMLGFGCQVLAYDPIENPGCTKLGVHYVDLTQLVQQSDIISLHCPLNQATQHIIDQQAISQMKSGVMLINTSRGALVDTQAVVQGLKSGQVGYFGLDVYEEESELFFRDKSDDVIQDDVFARLLTFPNVLITGHQAYLTEEALAAIAKTTLDNINGFINGSDQIHIVTVDNC
jgi:D-lactate dehydrogenase